MNVVRHRSAVRIRGFHPRDRGSTPRVGTFFLILLLVDFKRSLGKKNMTKLFKNNKQSNYFFQLF